MIVNRCVEQGIYVVLILSLNKDHRPLRSVELSEVLSVSDTYLKKLLRKLVLAGIVVSSPGRDGGFQLARPVGEISLYDVYAALEGDECELKMTGIGSRIFVYGEGFTEGEQKVRSAFGHANEAFCEELRKMMLSELVMEKHTRNGYIDFAAHLAQLRQS